jgi:hypothetical protein
MIVAHIKMVSPATNAAIPYRKPFLRQQEEKRKLT